MVTMTRASGSNNFKIYVDGSFENSGTWDGTDISNSNKLFIGKRGDPSSAYFFDGKLDEVGIWDRVLSSTEITELYNSGSGLAYPFSSATIENLSDTQSFSDSMSFALTKNLSESVVVLDKLPDSAESLSIDYNNGVITQAKMMVIYTGNTPELYMSADGHTFESVENDVVHTFSNTGQDLKWKISGASTTITKIRITDY